MRAFHVLLIVALALAGADQARAASIAYVDNGEEIGRASCRERV